MQHLHATVHAAAGTQLRHLAGQRGAHAVPEVIPPGAHVDREVDSAWDDVDLDVVMQPPGQRGMKGEGVVLCKDERGGLFCLIQGWSGPWMVSTAPGAHNAQLRCRQHSIGQALQVHAPFRALPLQMYLHGIAWTAVGLGQHNPVQAAQP